MTDAFSDEDKKKFIIVQELSRKGDNKSTLKLLQELVCDNPNSGIMNAMLANAYKGLGDLESAEKYLKIAVKLSPSSEKISRGLLHVLWDKKDEINAVNEIQRFIDTGSASDEYKEIAVEINSKRDFYIEIN